jgi:DNA-directed RNA polymerase delta subunit
MPLGRSMTWANAAYDVLKRAREPLKPSEIVEQSVRFGLITMKTRANIQMASSIRQDADSRFFSIGRGRWGLSEWLKRNKATIADLAYWILKSENKVLHYREITEQILKVRGLGKTPEIAVYNVLRNYKEFQRFGKSKFGLKRWRAKESPFAHFVYATPSQFWKMANRVSNFLGSARQVVRVCSPYVDKSTFQTFLSQVPQEVETELIVTDDKLWEKKVKGGLSGDFLRKFSANRRLVTRRADELHSRFIMVDDVRVCLLSADLQKEQQTNKYQYSYFTNDDKITRNVISYFDELWRNSSVCDLEAEARALAKP